MEKIFADETPNMTGFVQAYTDDLFQAWVSSQSDEYLAQTEAFEVWNTFKRLAA